MAEHDIGAVFDEHVAAEFVHLDSRRRWPR